MKSIREILGDIQQVFDFDFDYRLVFDEKPTKEHLFFINILRILDPEKYLYIKARGKKGRPPKDRLAIYKSYIASKILQISTRPQLISRLLSDRNLRKICGFQSKKDIPSESVLSRSFSEYADEEISQKIHKAMIMEYVSPQLVGHISRDSTAIHTREKPVNTKKEVKDKKPKRKRGRPKKGEIIEPKEPTVIEKQIDKDPYKSLQELNLQAAWGCKKNSQGKRNHWKGYKLHLDVTDIGLPVTAMLTGANVYDNQVAIPMEKITEQKVTFLYSLMDSAYDAKTIKEYISSRGRIPVIDSNKRRGEKQEFCPAKKERYKIRSVVERSNSHLKDWLFGSAIYVKGYKKVYQDIMLSVVVLTALKILQYIDKPAFIKQAA